MHALPRSPFALVVVLATALASSSCALFTPLQCADACCACLPGPATSVQLRSSSDVRPPQGEQRLVPLRPSGALEY